MFLPLYSRNHPLLGILGYAAVKSISGYSSLRRYLPTIRNTFKFTVTRFVLPFILGTILRNFKRDTLLELIQRQYPARTRYFEEKSTAIWIRVSGIQRFRFLVGTTIDVSCRFGRFVRCWFAVRENYCFASTWNEKVAKKLGRSLYFNGESPTL